MMEWGSYCQSKVYGSCPVSCTADQLLGSGFSEPGRFAKEPLDTKVVLLRDAV